MTDQNASLAKIGKLEAENRRIKWVLGLFIPLFTLFAFLVLVERVRTKNTLEAREFLLRDQSGQVLARLGPSIVGTCFEISGKTREAAAVICAGDNSGSSLALATNHGESKAVLSAGGKMYEAVGEILSPGLIITKEGKHILTATAGAEPTFLVGPNGKIASVVLSFPQDRPTIRISGSDGKILWSAP